MKSNRQARHILGLNYKLSNQRKVVIEGDHETQVTHATGRKRHAGKCSRPRSRTPSVIPDGVFVYVLCN